MVIDTCNRFNNIYDLGEIILKITKAGIKARKKWDKNNRDHRNYLSGRSASRSFIRNKATEDDLNELQELIDERRTKLNNIQE